MVLVFTPNGVVQTYQPPIVDVTHWPIPPLPNEIEKEAPTSWIDLLVLYTMQTIVFLIGSLFKGLKFTVVGIWKTLKFILRSMRSMIARAVLTPWLEIHFPAWIVDCMHRFFHWLGHRGTGKQETYLQTIARQEQEAFNMAQAYIDLNELYQESDDTVTELLKQLGCQTKQKNNLQRDHEEVCQYVAVVEGRKEDLTFALEEKEEEFKRMEEWYFKKQSHFDHDTNYMETKMKRLQEEATDAKAYGANCAQQLEKQTEQHESQTKEHERQAADAETQHAADVQKLNDKIKELEAQAIDLNTQHAEKIKKLESQIKDYEKGAEEMGEQAATDMLEKEEMEEEVKKQKDRADDAEKKLAAATQKIETLEEKPSQQSNATQTDEDTNATEAKVHQREGLNTELQSILAEQGRELNALQSRQSSVDVVTAWADAAEAKIKEQEVQNTELQGMLAEQERELKALQSRQSSIDVVTAWADTAEAKIKELEVLTADSEVRLAKAEEEKTKEIKKLNGEWETKITKTNEGMAAAIQSRDAAHRDLDSIRGEHQRTVARVQADGKNKIDGLYAEAREYETKVQKEKQDLQNEIGNLQAQLQSGHQSWECEKARADDCHAQLNQAMRANNELILQIQQLQQQGAASRALPNVPGRVTFKQKWDEEIKAHEESKRALKACETKLTQATANIDARVKIQCGSLMDMIKKLRADNEVLKKERDGSRANNQFHQNNAQNHKERCYDLEKTLKELKLEIMNMREQKSELQRMNNDLGARKGELEGAVAELEKQKKELGEHKKKLMKAALQWQGLIKDAEQVLGREATMAKAVEKTELVGQASNRRSRSLTEVEVSDEVNGAAVLVLLGWDRSPDTVPLAAAHVLAVRHRALKRRRNVY